VLKLVSYIPLNEMNGRTIRSVIVINNLNFPSIECGFPILYTSRADGPGSDVYVRVSAFSLVHFIFF